MKILRIIQLPLVVLILILISMNVTPVESAIFNVTLGGDIYGTYDDNFLLQNDDQIDASNEDPHDKILQIRPFIQVMHEGKRYFVRGKYTLFHEWYYIDHNISRDERSYVNVDLAASWDMTDRLTLALYDDYKDSLYGLEQEEIPEIREGYITNVISPQISYSDADRLNLGLKVRWQFLDYNRDPILYDRDLYGYLDWEEVGAEVTANVKFLTCTDIILGGGFWTREYDNICCRTKPDVDGYNLRAGVTQRFGDRVSVSGWLNYDHREYSVFCECLAKEKYDNFGGFLEINNQFSEVSRLTLGAHSNFSSSERFSNGFYRDTGVDGIYVLKYWRHVEISTQLGYSTLEYDNIGETFKDDYYRARFTVGYQAAEWVSIRLRYQYAERDSERDEYDFNDNLVSLYLHIKYDLFH
ncbi:outer membrane beta-barrel protein [bacterium]|nr:outer membrane beta-barrel protein [candidate division CSSED10-310 bacterium]